MNEGPFARSRTRYIDPTSSGVYCVGSKTECGFLLDDGATHVAWTKEPAQFGEVLSLYMLPTPNQVKKPKSIPYLNKLRATQLLSIPAPLLPTLTPATVPPKLVTLQIGLDGKYTDGGKQIPRWPEDLVLPNLRGLMFMGTYGASATWPKLGLEPRHVPGLEFLVSDVDDECTVVDALEGFASLRHLEVAGIGNCNRIFDVAPAGLEVLRLGGSKLEFSVAGIVGLKKLTALWLGRIKTEIDFELLRELPELAEINVVDSKKLVNIEALLECPALRRVSFLDCGGPFKKPLRQRFQEHGFEALAIDFA